MSDDPSRPTRDTNPRDEVPGDTTVQDLLKRAAQDVSPPWPVGEEETAIRNMTFWRDGFQFDNGELRRYDDPSQAQILHEINVGRAPPSALNVRPGQRVELRVNKRLGEDYIPPKKKE